MSETPSVWRLGDHLERLLVEHGIPATQQDGVVHVGANESQWARLTATRETESSPVQLQIDAAGPGGVVVSDSVNGWGSDAEAALGDALLHFCVGDFHVLLAGLWGLLEEDQVDHYVASTENGRWDLYFGAWVSRMSDPQKPLPAPDPTFANAVVEAAPRLLNERRPYAGRVFVGALNGELTYEALFDMQPSAALEEALRSVPLQPPTTGYASQRLFFLALPQDGEPAHARVGQCAPVVAPASASLRATWRLWIGVAVATILIAALYAVLR
jgi:hypothetical protein